MKKVIAFSDLHGNYELWTSIKNYYNKNDILIFLGDACDRGPDGIKIMQEMLNDNRIIYILGNHEQMLIDFFEEGINEQTLKENKKIINYNGCSKTLEDFLKLSIDNQYKLINDLKEKTKKYYIYINKEKNNIFLSHAGIDIEKISDLGSINERDLLWDRKHMLKTNIWNNKFKYWYIIHGHTPTQIINPKQIIPKIYKYYNNHKIDLDLGTPSSNTIATINLNNFQVQYFKTIGGNNNG